MTKQIIFITGANGFVGRVIVNILSKTHQIYALVRPGTIPGFILNDNVRVVYGDLTDEVSLENAIPRKATIINLAANPYHPQLSYLVNVEGVKKLLRVAKKKKTVRFIQISSQATKIKIKGVYAQTKSMADALVRNAGIPYVICKPSLIYGEGERGLFARVAKLMRALPFVPIFGDGETKVNPIRVEDVGAYLQLIVDDKDLSNKEWEMGSLKPVTYNDLYRTIAGEQKVNFVHISRTIGLILAYMMRILPNPPIFVDNVLGSTQDTNCDSTKIAKHYHFLPKEFGVNVGIEKKTRLAVVGLGKMGTLHLTLLSTFPEVEIVALVDTNKALFSTAKSMGVRGSFYSSLKEAIQNEELDAVYLITPTFTHLRLMKEAIKAKLHIFVEKPVGLNSAEVEELAKLRYDRVIHVGYTLLYSRVFQSLKEILASKRYGKIVSVSGSFAHGEVFGPKKGWMFNKKLSGGGVLMNPGPHFFSVLQLLFGHGKLDRAKITDKFGTGLDDTVKARILFSDFVANVKLSWSVANKATPETKLVIVCEEATLSTDGHNIEVEVSRKNKKIISENTLPKSEEKIFNLNPDAYGEAYYLENKYFLEAIRGNKRQVPNSLAMAIMIEKQIANIYEYCEEHQ